MNRSTDKAVKNFLKVAFRSLIRPTRLLTGLLSIITAAVIPQISLPVLAAGVLAVIGMSWADINNPDFISKVLTKKRNHDTSYNKRIQTLINQLKTKQSQKNIFTEVKIDVDETIETLEKISQVMQILPADEQGSLDFVVEQVEKLVNRLIKLLNKEQLARKFLNNEDKSVIERELNSLQNNLENIKDKIARTQIEKVIKQKIAQIDNHNQVEHRLVRIDAYIANIRAALFTTYSNLTKLQLKDEGSFIDETDILTESMRQIVSEIDAFEEMNVDIQIGENKKSNNKREKESI